MSAGASGGRCPNKSNGSQLTKAQRQALDEFRVRTGAVLQQRSGRGVIYRIVNRQVIEQHLNELVPLADEVMGDQPPQRAANIGRSRSSKTGQHGHDLYYLLLKARGPVQWHSGTCLSLDLELTTRQQGTAVLTIGGDSEQDWYSDTSLWLVENQALFDRLDWLPGGDAASIVWYSGQLRTCLIDWLVQRPRAASIRLFPDYDGVGLHNYLRLRRRLGDQVSFWLMPEWEARLRQFGSNELWRKTAPDFHAALEGLQPLLEAESDLYRLMRTMQTLGLALEQEAVWLSVQDHNRG